MSNRLYFGDNLTILKTLDSETVDLIFIDPPYNKRKTQVGRSIKTEEDINGLIGFEGKKYSRKANKITGSYADTFDDYIGFMKPRIIEAHRLLKETGSFYMIADESEIHYLKVMCDEIFGRENYRRSLYWTWDYGVKVKNNYPNKVNEILYYVKDKTKEFAWNYMDLATVPYLSKGKLIPQEKRDKGKRITNCWFLSIEGTNSKDRKDYGYPTMKPKKLLQNIITASSNAGDVCLDFFAGSCGFGGACKDMGREFILIDNNGDSKKIMEKRFPEIEIVDI